MSSMTALAAPTREIRRRSPLHCAWLLISTLALFILLVSANPVSQAAPLDVVQGKLLSAAGTGPILRIRGKDISLESKNSFLFHTLEDKRLRDREVRLEGTSKPDGSFEVERLYTVHNGKLYRVRYYCEVCNIEALEPGDCVCCQQPTELQEVPVDGADKKIIVTR